MPGALPPLDAGTPQQAGVIAIRDGDEAEVCLIRRKGSEDWGIPKGTIEPGDTAEQAALNEAFEEAGLRGALVGHAIGTYDYPKWGVLLTVAVYVMEVAREEGAWQEMRIRERRWMPFEEAGLLLADHPVRPLLDRVAVARRK